MSTMKSNGILFAFHSVSRACGVNNSFSQNKNKLTVRHTMDALIQELKIKLITLLNLQDLTSESFDADAQLVGGVGGFGLDPFNSLKWWSWWKRIMALLSTIRRLDSRFFLPCARLPPILKTICRIKTFE